MTNDENEIGNKKRKIENKNKNGIASEFIIA
jgi:hypothetical protein